MQEITKENARPIKLELIREKDSKRDKKEARPKQEVGREKSKGKAGSKRKIERKTGMKKIEPEREIEKEIGGDEAGPGAEEEIGLGAKGEAGFLSWSLLGFSLSITLWHFFAYFLMCFCFCFSLLSRLVAVFGLSEFTSLIRLFLL